MSHPQQPGPWDEYAKIPPRTTAGPQCPTMGQGPAAGQSQAPHGQGMPGSRQPGPAQPSGTQQGAGGYVPYGASAQGAQGQGPQMHGQGFPNQGMQRQGAPRRDRPQSPGAPKSAGMFNVPGLLAILAGGLGAIIGGATLLLHGALPRWVGWVAVGIGVVALLLALLGLILPAFKGRRGLAVGGAAAGVVALGLLSPGILGHGGSPGAEPSSTATATENPSPSQTSSPTPSWNTSEPNSSVTIELSGTTTDGSPMAVSYAYSNNLPGANETRASEVLSNQPSGWSVTVTLPVNTLKDDSYIQLSANSEGYTGQSTCTIKVDGVVRSQHTNNNGICEASRVTE